MNEKKWLPIDDYKRENFPRATSVMHKNSRDAEECSTLCGEKVMRQTKKGYAKVRLIRTTWNWSEVTCGKCQRIGLEPLLFKSGDLVRWERIIDCFLEIENIIGDGSMDDMTIIKITSEIKTFSRLTRQVLTSIIVQDCLTKKTARTPRATKRRRRS